MSLVTGEYRALSPEEFDNDEDFQKAVLASTSIPVIWPPVKEIRIKNEAFRDSVDGGIRNISPLGDVIEFDPSEVIIINCSSSRIRLKEDTKASANIFRIAKRALTEITLDEIFNTDITEFLRINRLVQQAERQGCQLLKQDGRPYKSFRTVLIEPDHDLGDTLDFSRDLIEFRMAEGLRKAKEAFEISH